MIKKILVIGCLVFLTTPVLAQSRGAFSSVFASWYTVTTTTQTISLPYKSRDIEIRNGSSNAICADLKGQTINTACATNSVTQPSIFYIDGDTNFELSDFVTDSISLKTWGYAAGTTASPVSVIVTY